MSLNPIICMNYLLIAFVIACGIILLSYGMNVPPVFPNAPQSLFPSTELPMLPEEQFEKFTHGYSQEYPTKEACELIGGEWIVWPNPDASPACNLPTSDGGKLCIDSGQCESFCLAPENASPGSRAEGTCWGWVSPPACYWLVISGVVSGGTCA